MTIGVHPTIGLIRGFDGLVDNVFIYKDVLTDAQIEDIRIRGRDAILPVPGSAAESGVAKDAAAPLTGAEKARRAWVSRECEWLAFIGASRVVA